MEKAATVKADLSVPFGRRQICQSERRFKERQLQIDSTCKCCQCAQCRVFVTFCTISVLLTADFFYKYFQKIYTRLQPLARSAPRPRNLLRELRVPKHGTEYAQVGYVVWIVLTAALCKYVSSLYLVHNKLTAYNNCRNCSGDIRDSGRRGSDIFPRHWSPHCCRRWRAAIHSVSVPTSEYRHPAWECCQCYRHCV